MTPTNLITSNCVTWNILFLTLTTVSEYIYSFLPVIFFVFSYTEFPISRCMHMYNVSKQACIVYAITAFAKTYIPTSFLLNFNIFNLFKVKQIFKHKIYDFFYIILLLFYPFNNLYIQNLNKKINAFQIRLSYFCETGTVHVNI